MGDIKTDPCHPQFVRGFKAGHAAGRKRGEADSTKRIADLEAQLNAAGHDSNADAVIDDGEDMKQLTKQFVRGMLANCESHVYTPLTAQELSQFGQAWFDRDRLRAALRDLLGAAVERDGRNRVRQFDEFVANAKDALDSSYATGPNRDWLDIAAMSHENAERNVDWAEATDLAFKSPGVREALFAFSDDASSTNAIRVVDAVITANARLAAEAEVRLSKAKQQPLSKQVAEFVYPPLPEPFGQVFQPESEHEDGIWRKGLQWSGGEFVYNVQHMHDYADATRESLSVRIAELEAQLTESKRDAGAKQAQIDELMLEFCPDEMTPEQFNDWAAHQAPAAFDGSTKP